jgi:hypothetical protein
MKGKTNQRLCWPKERKNTKKNVSHKRQLEKTLSKEGYLA